MRIYFIAQGYQAQSGKYAEHLSVNSIENSIMHFSNNATYLIVCQLAISGAMVDNL